MFRSSCTSRLQLVRNSRCGSALRLQLRLADGKSPPGVNSVRSASESAAIHRFDDSVILVCQSAGRIANHAGTLCGFKTEVQQSAARGALTVERSGHVCVVVGGGTV